MNWQIFIFVFLFLNIVSGVKKSYEDYKVYSVKPDSEDKLKILEDVETRGIGEFWDVLYNINQPVKVMVSKEEQNNFLKLMKDSEIETVEVIGNLQKAINDTLKPATSTIRTNEKFHSMTWDRYYNLDDINSWLDELVEAYPNIVTEEIIGQSVEGRDIKGIKLNYKTGNKHIGVIEGTLHAREWISAATVTWIIKEFLTSTNPEVRAMAENFEWHIFPIVNPDGYSYTFTDNRMWRKNRNTAYNTTCTPVDNDMSNGVDLNRNFGYQWMVIGASNNSCTNTYAGPYAFSEPESINIAQHVLSLREQGEIIYYLAFHSYTQLVVIPYSHLTSGFDALKFNNYGDMYEVGIRAATKLQERFGTQYRVGISADVLYPMSGTSFDWVKYQVDVPICYLIELRDLGQYGFLLPAEQIIPNNLEIMDFVIEMDRATRQLGYYNK